MLLCGRSSSERVEGARQNELKELVRTSCRSSSERVVGARQNEL